MKGKIEVKLDAVVGHWQAEHNEDLSMLELSKRLDGVSVDFLYRLRAGDIKRLDMARLAELCAYFGIQPGDLLVYVPDAPAP